MQCTAASFEPVKYNELLHTLAAWNNMRNTAETGGRKTENISRVPQKKKGGGEFREPEGGSLFVTQEPGANRAVVKHMLMFIQEHKRQSVHEGAF